MKVQEYIRLVVEPRKSSKRRRDRAKELCQEYKERLKKSKKKKK